MAACRHLSDHVVEGTSVWMVSDALSMAHTFREKANRHWQEYSMATVL
jgi:hypothetical protein